MIKHQRLELRGTLFSETPIYIYIVYDMVYDIENMSSFPEGDPKYIQLPPRFAFRDLPGGVSQLHSDATSGGRVTRILGFGW